MHAADVLHATYYLTCHPVQAFIGSPPSNEDIIDMSPMPLAENMSNLEVQFDFSKE